MKLKRSDIKRWSIKGIFSYHTGYCFGVALKQYELEELKHNERILIKEIESRIK